MKKLNVWRAWYAKNREKISKDVKDWKLRNPEKVRIQRERSRERRLATTRAWRKNSRETYLAGMRDWKERNPEKVRAFYEKKKHISPIHMILNEEFKGSELHHTGIEMDGSFVGIYIPRSLNRGHCAQKGKEKNLGPTNWSAIEWVVREWE